MELEQNYQQILRAQNMINDKKVTKIKIKLLYSILVSPNAIIASYQIVLLICMPDWGGAV